MVNQHKASCYDDLQIQREDLAAGAQVQGVLCCADRGAGEEELCRHGTVPAVSLAIVAAVRRFPRHALVEPAAPCLHTWT